MSDGEIVQVTSQRPAFANPNFVIDLDGKLYVTLAVIEYDPKAADLSPEQKRGVKQMRQMFEEGHKKKALRAAPLDAGWGDMAPINSGPINSRPNQPGKSK